MSGATPLKADLHIHTARSGDNDISSRDIIHMAIENELDVVGVVDHDTTRGGIETRELAKKEMPDLLVLVGQETRTADGELISFGSDRVLPKGEPLGVTCRKAKDLGCFLVAPHPFDLTREGIGENLHHVLEYIDAIEVFNAKSMWKRFNKKAMEFAERYAMPGVAGSDAHFPEQIGMAYTLIDSKKTENAVYEAIRSGNITYSGKIAGFVNKKMFRRMGRLVKGRIRR